MPFNSGCPGKGNRIPRFGWDARPLVARPHLGKGVFCKSVTQQAGQQTYKSMLVAVTIIHAGHTQIVVTAQIDVVIR